MTDMSDNTDKIWRRSEIESPCIKVCVIEPKSRLCLGCLRSIDEIGSWSQMTPEMRTSVMEDLPSRKSKISQRRGGRAAKLDGRDAS